jgi:hypothetical protein
MTHDYKAALEEFINEQDHGELSQHLYGPTRGAIRAALELADRMQWQPIEAAPRDGTEVLLWCGWVTIGKWEADYSLWYDENGINPIFQVTHWMPLPTPPKETV